MRPHYGSPMANALYSVWLKDSNKHEKLRPIADMYQNNPAGVDQMLSITDIKMLKLLFHQVEQDLPYEMCNSVIALSDEQHRLDLCLRKRMKHQGKHKLELDDDELTTKKHNLVVV
jgi:hypothetical protein